MSFFANVTLCISKLQCYEACSFGSLRLVLGSILFEIIVARALDGGTPLSFELTHLPPKVFCS